MSRINPGPFEPLIYFVQTRPFYRLVGLGGFALFTIGLAKEVAADGIRVNAVRPGVTRTDMNSETLDDPAKHLAIAATIPIQRIAEASEVAKPILWLLSPESSFVTGALLDVSGGGFVIGPIAPKAPQPVAAR